MSRLCFKCMHFIFDGQYVIYCLWEFRALGQCVNEIVFQMNERLQEQTIMNELVVKKFILIEIEIEFKVLVGGLIHLAYMQWMFA